jgi:hypothetical protein
VGNYPVKNKNKQDTSNQADNKKFGDKNCSILNVITTFEISRGFIKH